MRIRLFILTVLSALFIFPFAAYCQGIWTQQLVHSALKEKNPNYNGRGQFKIENGLVVVAVLSGTGVTDLSPLRKMHVQILDLRGEQITDLSSLMGMSLTQLYLENTVVADLSPLEGMPPCQALPLQYKGERYKLFKGYPLAGSKPFGHRRY